MAMSRWIDQHLETFVRPVLGAIPSTKTDSYQAAPFLDTSNLDSIQMVWEAAKKRSKGRKILLAGRDVHLFEVLAQVEGNHLTVFRPEISSRVAKSGLIPKEEFEGYYLLDTGYRGTVPIALGMKYWDLMNYSSKCLLNVEKGAPYQAVTQEERELHQVFPNRESPEYRKCINLAPTLESAPKYWESGDIDKRDTPEASIKQVQSGASHFTNCAIVVQLVAKHAMREGLLKSALRKLGRG